MNSELNQGQIMCGVFAVLKREGEVNSGELTRAMHALHHRGPDGQRYWISKNKKVGLAHTRLSIIDLQTGAQPLSNPTDTIFLVANGELYDFERIRAELMQKGHQFKTQSDSEIAIHLYEEYGLDFVNYLRGEFTVILWDERQQQLVVVRDRFGIKPLFYTQYQNNFYFASEAKAIFSAGVPAQWDEASLFYAMNGATPPQDSSLFHQVKMLAPGHMLIINPQAVIIKKYWDFNYPLESVADAEKEYDELEYIDEFRRLFSESVRLRQRADVPVGFYLSGGIDSSAVLGFARQHTTAPMHSFTLTFTHKQFDESSYAQETAEKIDSIHHVVPIHSTDLTQHFSDALWHGETLMINGHAIAKYLLSKKVRDVGIKVVMTGEGSDEILAGYASFRKDLLSYSYSHLSADEKTKMMHQLYADNVASQGLFLPENPEGTVPALQEKLGFSPAWMDTFVIKNFLEYCSESSLKKYKNYDFYHEFMRTIDISGQLKGRNFVNQSLYLWSKSQLPNYILSVLGDRMEMAHSIEGRVPFLDHNLVEFATKLPISLKIKGMNEKYILKEAAKEVITDTVYNRQKHPFLAAPCTSPENESFYQLIQDTLRSASLNKVPFIERSKVNQLLDNLSTHSLTEQIRMEPLLMKLTSACLLAERFAL